MQCLWGAGLAGSGGLTLSVTSQAREAARHRAGARKSRGDRRPGSCLDLCSGLQNEPGPLPDTARAHLLALSPFSCSLPSTLRAWVLHHPLPGVASAHPARLLLHNAPQQPCLLASSSPCPFLGDTWGLCPEPPRVHLAWCWLCFENNTCWSFSRCPKAQQWSCELQYFTLTMVTDSILQCQS